MLHHRRCLPLIAVLACALGCAPASPVRGPTPVVVKPGECWTLADDETIPTPPADDAPEADQVQYEADLTATFWRLRCACGARRPAWCTYPDARRSPAPVTPNP